MSCIYMKTRPEKLKHNGKKYYWWYEMKNWVIYLQLCPKYSLTRDPAWPDPDPTWLFTGLGLGRQKANLTRPDPTRPMKWVGFGQCFLTRTQPGCILTLVPPSVMQKTIVCLIIYHPSLQISDLEGTYKHPCTSRPLCKRIILFFTTFLREHTPLYPSFALWSPCVAKRF
jgi:hypothetical protein